CTRGACVHPRCSAGLAIARAAAAARWHAAWFGRGMSALLLLSAAIASAPPATPATTSPACHVFVRGFTGEALTPREDYLVAMLADAVANAVAKKTGCRVTTSADVRTLLDATAEKQLCGDDSASCVAEVGQALGADTIVEGTLRGSGAHF